MYHSESVTAAYLGFKCVCDLQRFLFCHYFLDHFFRYQKDGWALDVKKDIVLVELKDGYVRGEKYVVEEVDEARIFPPREPEYDHDDDPVTAQQQKDQYDRRRIRALVYLLIFMVEDLDGKADQYNDFWPQEWAVKKLEAFVPFLLVVDKWLNNLSRVNT